MEDKYMVVYNSEFAFFANTLCCVRDLTKDEATEKVTELLKTGASNIQVGKQVPIEVNVIMKEEQ